MRKRITLGLTMLCLLLLPVTVYGSTQNLIPYLIKSEKDKVHLGQIKINNLYHELKPGEYFSLSLTGAQFDEDSNGKSRVYSSGIEFDKVTKTRVTGRFLDNVVNKEEVNISFYSKILEDVAVVEIDGEDSHLTSGSYMYALDKDADISNKSTVSINGPKFFHELIDLEPIIIKEKYPSAFQSLQIYEYKVDELIDIRLAKGEYEFYNKGYIDPITLVLEQADGKEKSYQIDRDIELQLSPDRSRLTFKQYNQDILEPSDGAYTIRIENLRIVAVNPSDLRDLYIDTTGKWLKDEKILIGKQVRDQLVIESSAIQDKSKGRQRVKFSIHETVPGLIFTEKELTFGLADRLKIDFEDDFKLKLIDGLEEVLGNKLEIERENSLFTIQNYKRQFPYNLIEIEGEFTGIIPEEIRQDIRFLVSAPEITKVFYYTLIEAEDIEDTGDMEEPVNNNGKQQMVQFKEASNQYLLGGKAYPMDASPYISQHNRIMVPLRYVSYALGIDPENLKWDSSTQMITIKGDKPMTINVQTREMNMSHVITTLSEIKIIDGRTFVPVGEIGKAFGAKVTWDGESRMATFN